MARASSFLLFVVACLIFAILVPEEAAATHWVEDTDVEVYPSTTKPGRTVTFQIDVRNDGDVSTTVCEVTSRFEWESSSETVFSGSHELGAGTNTSWPRSVDVPPLPPGSYRHTVIISAMRTSVLPPELECTSNDWQETLVVVANVPPAADFTFEPTNPQANATVLFHDRSTDPDGVVVAWYWDFGDGEHARGEEEMHQFASPGTYQVVLTVTDDDGVNGSASKNVTVAAIIGNMAPVSDFSFSPATVVIGAEVRFTDESSDADGVIVAWRWEFGDGSNSIEQHPSHQFETAGEHQVSLTVTDDDGSTSVRKRTLQVGAASPSDGSGASGFGYIEWGLVAFGVGAIATLASFAVRRVLRPRRRWGQAHNHKPSTDTKSWRQQLNTKSWRQPTDSKSRWRLR